MNPTQTRSRATRSKPWAPLGGTVIALLLCACGEDPSEPALEAGPSGAQPKTDLAPWFEEVAAQSGVDFVHGFGEAQKFWMPEVSSSGLGLFDMDGDGDLDLYVLQGTEIEPAEGAPPFDARNRLYENQGDGTFQDVTERAGVGDTGFGHGCAVGDYDSDGLLDLYVTNVGPNVLYRNLGDGRFEDVTEAAGVSGEGWGTSTTFLDYDLDGHLDLYVANYIIWKPEFEIVCKSNGGERTYCSPNSYQGPDQDHLYRNRGDGTFEKVTEAAGLLGVKGNGLGVVWGQLDDRPGLDLYVANDGTPNQFWSQKPDGTFEDRAMQLGCAVSNNGVAEAGMGVCLEDINRDGQWDLTLTHLAGETNTFYMGGSRGYRDQSRRTGTTNDSLASTGFGVGMADFDHDGLLDLYVANGRVIYQSSFIDPDQPLAEPDQLFQGLGGGKFRRLDDLEITGSQVATVGRGAAFGDIDNDGDVDICINDHRGHLRILRNIAPKAGGSAAWSVLERDGLAAVGAVCRFDLAGTRVMRQVQRTYSYCASNDPRLHVGLGDEKSIASVEVTWLDGVKETFGPLAAGETATLRRGEGR